MTASRSRSLQGSLTNGLPIVNTDGLETFQALFRLGPLGHIDPAPHLKGNARVGVVL